MVNKLIYSYHEILCSHIKKWSTDSHYIMKKISKTCEVKGVRHKRALYFMILFIWQIHIGKSTETKSRLVFFQGIKGRENEEWLLNGYGVSLQGDENVLELDKRWWLHNTVNILNATDCIL